MTVVSMSGQPAATSDKCAEVIAMCEAIIARAKDSGAIGMAYTLVLPDRSVSCDWTPGCGPEILGGAAIMQYQMIRASA